MLAAVDGDVGAGDEGRLFRAEIDDQSGNFFGLAQACGRNLWKNLAVEHFFGDRRDHLGADVAGGDRVHGHTLLGRLERQRLGEAVHAGLGGGVVGLAEGALGAVHRRDVDDAAPAAIHHAVVDLLRHVEDAVEVRADHGVPGRLVHLAERHVLGDAGVVDEDVDGADLACHLRDARLGALIIADVARIGAHRVAPALHLLEPLGGRLVGGRIGDDYVVARVRHLGGDRLAETAHATGDQRDTFRHSLPPYRAKVLLHELYAATQAVASMTALSCALR